MDWVLNLQPWSQKHMWLWFLKIFFLTVESEPAVREVKAENSVLGNEKVAAASSSSSDSSSNSDSSSSSGESSPSPPPAPRRDRGEIHLHYIIIQRLVAELYLSASVYYIILTLIYIYIYISHWSLSLPVCMVAWWCAQHCLYSAHTSLRIESWCPAAPQSVYRILTLYCSSSTEYDWSCLPVLGYRNNLNRNDGGLLVLSWYSLAQYLSKKFHSFMSLILRPCSTFSEFKIGSSLLKSGQDLAIEYVNENIWPRIFSESLCKLVRRICPKFLICCADVEDGQVKEEKEVRRESTQGRHREPISNRQRDNDRDRERDRHRRDTDKHNESRNTNHRDDRHDDDKYRQRSIREDDRRDNRDSKRHRDYDDGDRRDKKRDRRWELMTQTRICAKCLTARVYNAVSQYGSTVLQCSVCSLELDLFRLLSVRFIDWTTSMAGWTSCY